jgi:guanylate kinase
LPSLFVVTAPSGAGKTSLVAELLRQEPELSLSVSFTTRSPRPGERDGTDYHFVARSRFESMIEAGDFIEHAQVFGNYYGTSRRWIADQMAAGRDVMLEIDWQGAAQVRRIFPGARGIFILPPSLEALRERLNRRGKDSAETIARRLAGAREEIAHVLDFDFIIVNDVFEHAATALVAVVRAEKVSRSAQRSSVESIIQQFQRT